MEMKSNVNRKNTEFKYEPISFERDDTGELYSNRRYSMKGFFLGLAVLFAFGFISIVIMVITFIGFLLCL